MLIEPRNGPNSGTIIAGALDVSSSRVAAYRDGEPAAAAAAATRQETESTSAV